MPQASTTSPFAAPAVTEEPWTLWQKSTPVLTLLNEKQTDGRYLREAPEPEPPHDLPVQPPQINRMQYLSVLSRMKNACGKAGTYAAWNTEE